MTSTKRKPSKRSGPKHNIQQVKLPIERGPAGETKTPTATPAVPACPRCNHNMVKRNGPRGPFWGCSMFPDCRGTRDLTDPGTVPAPGPRDVQTQRSEATPGVGTPSTPGPVKTSPVTPSVSTPTVERITRMPGSPEQEAIWTHLDTAQEHTVVDALAGVGKTWGMVQACLRQPRARRIGFLAFNKHIATEAQGKLNASGCGQVTCCTLHSLGLRVCKAIWPTTLIDEHKVRSILESMPEAATIAPQLWRNTISVTTRLVGFAKNYLLDPTSPELASRLEELCEHHAVDMNGSAKVALELVPRVLKLNIERAVACIDFDDMIWLPVVCNLPVPITFDLLITDEAQDLNLTQQELAMKFVPEGRLCLVGDKNQSIYSFRGADVLAIPRMIERLRNTERHVAVLPLTVTRRCPKVHVTMAQAVVPQIQALPDAPEGEVHSLAPEVAKSKMKPGDLVLCRVNAPLVSTAYSLIRRGIKAVIRGREIGKGLRELVDKLERRAFDLKELITVLQEYRRQQEDKLIPLGDRGTSRLLALQDKCDCLQEIIQECQTIEEVKTRITDLFADFEADGKPKHAVILGTVHRGKGLEAERVFILTPELLPHPMAKQDWEKQQENNIAYVAVTRVKFTATAPGTIVFCGPVPAVYKYTGEIRNGEGL